MQISSDYHVLHKSQFLSLFLQEDIATANLSKARKLQADVEEAEERADMAEQAVAKLRAKLRS